MEKEKEYLARVLGVLQNKKDNLEKGIQKINKQFQEKIQAHGEDFRDLSRGEDLSNAFNDLGQIEDLSLEKQKELKKINLQDKNPYFARIDFSPEGRDIRQKVYIGLGNVFDKHRILVIDWRAPISSLYYDFDLGEGSFKIDDSFVRGNISLKRQYKIENGQLISYFDTDMTINDDILQEILSKNASIKMKQIVSSIQKEQNFVVRGDLDQNILVQGVAGSGKTSIVLHRAAYLLYKHRKQLKNSDICIISPNNIFSSYISEVLPQLGEDNLVETTFAQIARAETKRPIQSREDMLDEIATNPKQELLNEISYKSSYEYLDDLLRFLKGKFIETFDPQTLSYVVYEDLEGNKETIDFTAEQTKELFFKTFKGLDLYERINKIAWQYAMFFTEKRHYNKEQNRALKERFKKILYRFLPIRDIDKVFQIFMMREGFELPKDKTIKYMDKGTYLLIKHFIYGFDHNFGAKYLIIDEMQDFTPVDIYIFKKIWHCPMIVVGDVNQCIEKNVTDEYLQLTADFLGCKLLRLNKTYRSTKEIAMFANNLVGFDKVEFVNRHGDQPVVYKTNDQISVIKDLIDKDSHLDHIAVICKCKKEANEVFTKLKKVMDCKLLEEPEDYNQRVLVTTCAMAKGIEFDGVIIPNCSKENYRNTIDKNIIYVSSTRALHKLYFTTDGIPSAFVNSLEVKEI